MKISVQAKTRSRRRYVKKVSDTDYIVAVSEAPIDGRANRAIREALSRYLDIPVSHIRILRGETAKKKILAYDV